MLRDWDNFFEWCEWLILSEVGFATCKVATQEALWQFQIAAGLKITQNRSTAPCSINSLCALPCRSIAMTGGLGGW